MTLAIAVLSIAVGVSAQVRAPIVYTVRVTAPDTHYVDVDATVPTDGRDAIELMMPIWSPGYYRVEDYAGRVDRVAARSAAGAELAIEKPQPNRWRIRTGSNAWKRTSRMG